jgi:hypothetical protein
LYVATMILEPLSLVGPSRREVITLLQMDPFWAKGQYT